jgi:nitrite reductase/ring-hydroxylating ferredoxin subunit
MVKRIELPLVNGPRPCPPHARDALVVSPAACAGGCGSSAVAVVARPALDRRALLLGAGAALAGACTDPFAGVDALCTFDVPPLPDSGDTCRGQDVGAVDEMPVGTYRITDSMRSFIARDARGFYAVDTACSHFATPLPLPNGDGRIFCPQTPTRDHGSVFTQEGCVLRGPAARPLTNFLVTICGGRVFVDLTRMVPLGTRKVPA